MKIFTYLPVPVCHLSQVFPVYFPTTLLSLFQFMSGKYITVLQEFFCRCETKDGTWGCHCFYAVTNSFPLFSVNQLTYWLQTLRLTGNMWYDLSYLLVSWSAFFRYAKLFYLLPPYTDNVTHNYFLFSVTLFVFIHFPFGHYHIVIGKMQNIIDINSNCRVLKS
jgi:hypothetical protein